VHVGVGVSLDRGRGRGRKSGAGRGGESQGGGTGQTEEREKEERDLGTGQRGSFFVLWGGGLGECCSLVKESYEVSGIFFLVRGDWFWSTEGCSFVFLVGTKRGQGDRFNLTREGTVGGGVCRDGKKF